MCDGFHSTPRQSRNRALPRHIAAVVHGNALDGIDGTNGIGTSKVRCHGRFIDMGDIWRHLGNNRDTHSTLNMCGKEQHQLRVLPHVASHASKAHLRTREIELQGVHTGLLGHLGKLYPFLLGLTHDRCHHNLAWIIFLEPPQYVEVNLGGILAKLLHVAQGVEVASLALAVNDVEAWRHLVDVLQADGLEEHSCPAGVEGAGYHLIVSTN